MKDIDFDELDKAVSSVLNPQVVTQPVVIPEETSSNVSTPLAEPSTSAQADTESQASRETPTIIPKERPQPSLAAPRRGKFMDVVHPSSDMTTPPPTTQITTSQKIVAPLTLEQPQSVVDTPVEMIPSTPSGEPVNTVEDTLVLDEPEQTVNSAETVDDKPAINLDIPAEVAIPGPVEAPEVAEAEFAAQVTPFLEDAKVEKRPLGAFGDDTKSNDTAEVEASTAPDPTLPPEFQPEILATEQNRPQATQAEEESAPVEQETSPIASENVASHPLFDTSTYHEPMLPAQKKHTSPWVWVTIGLGTCLVVGSGVGYFLFTTGF